MPLFLLNTAEILTRTTTEIYQHILAGRAFRQPVRGWGKEMERRPNAHQTQKFSLPPESGVGEEMERTNTMTSDSDERTVGQFSPPLVEPPYNCLLHSLRANVLVSALYSRAIYRVSFQILLFKILCRIYHLKSFE